MSAGESRSFEIKFSYPFELRDCDIHVVWTEPSLPIPADSPTPTPTTASERADGICHVGLIVGPGENCTYPGTSIVFSVDSPGRGRFLFFTAGTGIDARNTTINGVTYNFKASKQDDGTWLIEAAGDS